MSKQTPTKAVLSTQIPKDCLSQDFATKLVSNAKVKGLEPELLLGQLNGSFEPQGFITQQSIAKGQLILDEDFPFIEQLDPADLISVEEDFMELNS